MDKLRISLFWLLSFSLLFKASVLRAASCCGGGGNFPSIITGDFKAQLSGSMGYATVVGDAKAQGYYSRPESVDENSKILAIDASMIHGDYWQSFINTSIVERKKQLSNRKEDSTGLGDVSFGSVYEFLPELSYSAWKPRGFAFLKVQLPTAPSVLDAKKTLLTDARGEGFYSLSIGHLFVKVRGAWDFLAGAEYKYKFRKHFKQSGQRLTADPGGVTSLQLGAGYSFTNQSPWRLGLTLQPVFKERVRTKGDISSSSSASQFVNTIFSLSYLLNTEWMMSASYSDQTLLGPARNTVLERQASILLQKRWSL